MDWTTDNFRKAKWDPETEGLRGSRRALNKDKEVGKRQSVSSPKAALCTPSPSPGERWLLLFLRKVEKERKGLQASFSEVKFSN